MKNVSIKQLRAFVAVAREGSFTRAASKINVSPSAVTIAVRQLETEMNLQLFDRTTRAVSLTDHASLLLPVVERVLNDLTRSLDDLSAVADRQRGNVAAAASASYLCCVLVPTAAKIRKRFPGIHVKLLNMPENLARRVQEEEVDFGVTNVSRVPHGLESFPLLRDQFGVACPLDHPLARKPDPLTWKDLVGTTLVSMPLGTQTREIMDRHHYVTEMLEPPICEASSIYALGAMIEHGMGVAIVPALVSRAIVSDRLIYKPIVDPILERELFVIKRRGRSLSPAAAEVVTYMMKELAGISSRYIKIDANEELIIRN